MERILSIFKEICAIPHGSGNMEGIADYCVDFAKKNGLDHIRDKANNVIIKKKASPGYEEGTPVILQGHLDMVCQKEEGVSIDFEKEGITPVIEGDYMRAVGTTLGADNGIAVAMILALLERDDLSHPAIEAVFTTDEEIGMIGAGKLDLSFLAGKRMINLDGEEDAVTVSCAGGSDLVLSYPVSLEKAAGDLVWVKFFGLKGGHSGVEIHKGRINADLWMGRFLSRMAQETELSLVFLHGGDKANAIPFAAYAEFLVPDSKAFLEKAKKILSVMKEEISLREEDFGCVCAILDEKIETAVIPREESTHIFDALCTVPCGIVEMSPNIQGLVETSLNLGILKTEKDAVVMHFALRSNLASALVALEEKMKAFARLTGARAEAFGHYPPWEYHKDSLLRETYLEICREETGKGVPVEAIHAGLECGVFASGIPGLDCIAIGPNLFDVHTPKESMQLSSVECIFKRLVKLLSKLR